MTRRVNRGDRMLTAAEQNRIADGADLSLQYESARPTGIVRRQIRTDMIRVRNDTGGDRLAYQAVEIRSRITTEDLDRYELAYEAITPTGGDVPVGILVEPIPEDEFGWCQVAGVVPGRLDSNPSNHRYARPKNGGYTLEPAESGPMEILAEESGDVNALLRFGGSSGGETGTVPLSATFNGATASPTSESDIEWQHTSSTQLIYTGDSLPVTTNNGEYIEVTADGTYTLAIDVRATRNMVSQYESFKAQIELNGDDDLWGLMRGHLYSPAFDLAYGNVSRTITLNLEAGDKITVNCEGSADMGFIAWLNLQYKA